jgi:hypothetical protein
MKRRLQLFGGIALSFAMVSSVSAGLGPPHAGLVVDGVTYRTIGTPTDLSKTGAPLSSFDTLYAVEGQMLAVASAAPGDSDFNGGRWMRFPVTWNVSPYPLTSEEQVLAAAAAGDVTIAAQPDKVFECPVIRSS